MLAFPSFFGPNTSSAAMIAPKDSDWLSFEHLSTGHQQRVKENSEFASTGPVINKSIRVTEPVMECKEGGFGATDSLGLMSAGWEHKTTRS